MSKSKKQENFFWAIDVMRMFWSLDIVSNFEFRPARQCLFVDNILSIQMIKKSESAILCHKALAGGYSNFKPIETKHFLDPFRGLPQASDYAGGY